MQKRQNPLWYLFAVRSGSRFRCKGQPATVPGYGEMAEQPDCSFCARIQARHCQHNRRSSDRNLGKRRRANDSGTAHAANLT